MKKELRSYFKTKKVQKNKFRISNIIHLFILLLISIIFVGSFYFKKYYANETTEEIFFYLKNGVGYSDVNVFIRGLKICFPWIILICFVLILVFYNILIKKEVYLSISRKKTISRTIKKDILTIKKKEIQKNIKIYPITLFYNHKIICTIILSIISLVAASFNLGIFKYLKNNLSSSKFIQDNYAYIDKTKIKMDNKKNLIYIYLESFETTFFTKKQGGEWNYEVIEGMYKLLNDDDSVCFSCDNESIGMYQVTGTNWTTASIVSNSTSVPFKVPITSNCYSSNEFLNGVYALGDILKDNGYYNEVISAATTSFGGLKEFFTKHGNYNIVDIDTLGKYNLKITDKDLGSWGFNDKYLFDIAKTRLNKISKEKELFNLNLISIDTHHVDGFVGDYTIDKYDTQYENVYATTSKLVYDFVKWVQNQEFYKDTVIVIVGDHLNAQTDYFMKYDQDKRLIYNVIINSSKEKEINKARKYSSLDMLPTTLASIGAKFDKDKIGLGVNLYSSEETLVEKYGIKKLNYKLDLKSEFYNKKILGSDYYKMIDDKKE